jgi:hypothetical protein
MLRLLLTEAIVRVVRIRAPIVTGTSHRFRQEALPNHRLHILCQRDEPIDYK